MMMDNPRRKLIGTVGLLALLIVYSLLIMVFATSSLPSMTGVARTLFYVAAGLGWVPVAMLIVSWMYKHDKPRPRP